MINTNVNESTQKHLNTIETIVDGALSAIEADVSTMTAPDTAVLEKYPGFGKTVAEMLGRAEESLKLLQAEAGRATEWAQQRGYI